MLNPWKFQQVFILLILTLTCSSWGFLMHKTINQLAVYKLPKAMQPFFYKHIDSLVYNSVRPDVRRNKDSTEGPKHFIDLEKFGEEAAYAMPLRWEDAVIKYSKDSLLIYGYVPYHIIAMKDKLTTAFKSGNADTILFYAADIAHYISDAHVPLHTTINYDGQLTNQTGLHSLWESMIPEIEVGSYNLYSRHKAVYLTRPEVSIWEAVRGANALLPDMLAKESEVTKSFTPETKYRLQTRRGKEVKTYSSEFAKAYSASLGNTINTQANSSANLTADFWYTAWVDAGKPGLNQRFTKAEKKAFKAERRIYKSNRLLNNNLLQAKKEMPKSGE